jgi:crotonobetainyl-CoA:carnitine CoA-transferase CaiB-like acyl-CoA transferase
MDLDGAVGTVWRALSGKAGAPERVRWQGSGGALASELPVMTLAGATVAACALAAAELAALRSAVVPVDLDAVATAFTSERLLRVDGRAFEGFAPLSRFWPAADGWVRTHGNYPHHRDRLQAALLASSAEAMARRIASLPAETVAERVTAAGGLAVPVRTPAEWAAHPQGVAVAALPLLTLRHAAGGSPRPVSPRFRVLDLTRVIAGPIATRTLALFGADVLRVDSPQLAEIPAQHVDTGFGKRSTLLDLARVADRRTFDGLVASADVVVTGYRPGALDRYGLAPAALRDRRPDLVVARLSAWGAAGPWAARRGFDSLVQAACGIAVLEGRPDGRPGALPAQALDHGTGYLLAAAVLRGLSSRALLGGGWSAELSLAQTAWWLVNGGLHAPAGDGEPDPERWCAEMDSELGRLRYALPPVTLPGRPRTWAAPPTPWGSDPPSWLPGS